MKDEFSKLFKSLFDNSEAYLEIINLFAHDKTGITRAEIQKKAKLSANGGRLTERLRNLCDCGFLEERIAWGKKLGETYKLIDEFTLFQLKWLIKSKRKRLVHDYWLTQSNSQSYKIWSGYAFESVCLKHINQIITALGIKSAVSADSWCYIPRKYLEEGTQIDLLIDRSDNAITLCEIKFTHEPFSVDKQYAKMLQHKINIFQQKTKTKKQIFLALISAAGIKQTIYSEELISAIATLDDLFKSPQ